nr:sigma-70 family RNA polymerase sigma factor [uncultured Actinoplanes sp.]
MDAVEAVFREEHGRLLASLVHRFGDLDLAEEVASDALEAALVHWPAQGVPSNPGAWLTATARRKAVDRLRRQRAYAEKLALMHADSAVPAASSLPDERLELFFTCAHPALPDEARGALTLRYLGGLTTAEVARAYLVPAATMAQRLVRAKKKIRDARIPFRVPSAQELPSRLPGVLQVLYSIFTQGYVAVERPDLAAEAIRLARILRRLLPSCRDVTGLLALMLLVHARRPARAGGIVLLDAQDRTLWDRSLIEEGLALVPLALSGGPPGAYAVEAAIAALHDEAPSVSATDWPQIVALYDVLLAVTPSPVVEVNRAAAVAMRDGPSAGLALLDALGGDERLRAYGPYQAARADLLQRLDRLPEAAAAYRRALALAGTEPERRHLTDRLRLITESG